MFSRKSNRSSANSSSTIPSETDILCGKDKTYAKHSGNRVFRERIEAMKAAYCAAANKQEKMNITKDIVSLMQEYHGSRFLKMEGGMWLEIPEQAARDKVSHALRFAARNLKSEAKSSANKRSGDFTNRQPRKRRSRHHSEDSSSTSTTEELSESHDCCDDRTIEPIPFSQVFGFAAAIFSGKKARAQEKDDFVTDSLRSMNLLDEQREDSDRPFTTLRSDELNEILNEPLDLDEWEAVAEMAK